MGKTSHTKGGWYNGMDRVETERDVEREQEEKYDGHVTPNGLNTLQDTIVYKIRCMHVRGFES